MAKKKVLKKVGKGFLAFMTGGASLALKDSQLKKVGQVAAAVATGGASLAAKKAFENKGEIIKKILPGLAKTEVEKIAALPTEQAISTVEKIANKRAKEEIVSKVLPELDSDTVETLAALPTEKTIEAVTLIKENTTGTNTDTDIETISGIIAAEKDPEFIKTDNTNESIGYPEQPEVVETEKPKKKDFLLNLYDIIYS